MNNANMDKYLWQDLNLWNRSGIHWIYCNISNALNKMPDEQKQYYIDYVNLKALSGCVERTNELVASRWLLTNFLEANDIRWEMDGIFKSPPVLSKEIVVSMSHCKDSVCMLIGSRKRHVMAVGCDIQKMIGLNYQKMLNRMVITNDEKILIRNGNTELAQTLIFSCKETFFKTVHPLIKVYIYFDAVEVVAIDYSKQEVECVIVDDKAKIYLESNIIRVQYSVKDDFVITRLVILDNCNRMKKYLC